MRIIAAASSPLVPAQRLERDIRDAMDTMAKRINRIERLISGDQTWDFKGNTIALLGQIRGLFGTIGYLFFAIYYIVVRFGSEAGTRRDIRRACSVVLKPGGER